MRSRQQSGGAKTTRRAAAFVVKLVSRNAELVEVDADMLGRRTGEMPRVKGP